MSNKKEIKTTSDKPRLKKLIVKNYRCIGKNPVEIDLDDLIILVGPNNAGKSSILKAYELVMSEGSNKSKLSLEDFPNGQDDKDNLPEIEIYTVIYDNTVGECWINHYGEEKIVREKWIWHTPGDNPKRQGFNAEKGEWSESAVPWGYANVANSHRPEAHRIDAFDSPAQQTESIFKLLNKILTKKLQNMKDNSGSNKFRSMMQRIQKFRDVVINDAQQEITEINNELSSMLSKVFPNYKVDFDPSAYKPEDYLNLFTKDSRLLVGQNDGYSSPADMQGSGVRRVLLWGAIQLIVEQSRFAKNADKPSSYVRPNVLLLDEPEICLHPNIIRNASKALYQLAKEENWQVMVATHSPVFIDFSRDNTTVVRVERNEKQEVYGTTIFRSNKANLGKDDRENLKLLNACDPYVAEFFFSSNIIIVEGDTEYTAFKYVIEKYSNEEKYRDLHIIRARGKSTIVSLVKILNHFDVPYSVLHDSDNPKTDNGRKNPAWTVNESILKAVNDSTNSAKIRLLASIPNFENGYLSEERQAIPNKPYSALRNLMKDEKSLKIVKSLLDSLIDHAQPVPENCKEWKKISELENAIERVKN